VPARRHYGASLAALSARIAEMESECVVAEELRRIPRYAHGSWQVDETYVKVADVSFENEAPESEHRP
jgi:hypothetical protein